VFLVNAAVDRNLNMIRSAPNVGNADLGDLLGINMCGAGGGENRTKS